MLGLAVGDALAAATQYRRTGSFAAVGDMLGGGPFDLPRGAWSDDTAMALCLAESLVARGSFDARDQLERYRAGSAEVPFGHRAMPGDHRGHGARTGGGAVAQSPGGGSGRSGAARSRSAIARRADRPALLCRARTGGGRRRGCRARDQPVAAGARLLPTARGHAARGAERRAAGARARADAALFGAHPLRAPVVALAARAGDASDPAPAADGGALALLELARGCFAASANFRDGALRAINFGGDSDVIGAVYGQLRRRALRPGGYPARLAPGAVAVGTDRGACRPAAAERAAGTRRERGGPMKRRAPAWTRMRDEQLLQLRLCDLRLDLHALAAAAARITRLYRGTRRRAASASARTSGWPRSGSRPTACRASRCRFIWRTRASRVWSAR